VFGENAARLYGIKATTAMAPAAPPKAVAV
jgi:hypothetical protein